MLSVNEGANGRGVLHLPASELFGFGLGDFVVEDIPRDERGNTDDWSTFYVCSDTDYVVLCKAGGTKSLASLSTVIAEVRAAPRGGRARLWA